MGLKDFAAGALKKLASCGKVNGHDFPLGTYINLMTDDNERALLFTYPDKTEEKITHDMIKCATVLAMGVIDIENKGNQTTMLYGTKYLVVLNDGRQAILTVGLGELGVMIIAYIFFFFISKSKSFMKVIHANQNIDFKF